MDWRRYFIPTSYQLIIFSSISLIWLVAANIDAVTARLLPVSDLPVNTVANQNIADILNYLARFQILNTLVPAAFWVGVALVANLLLWGIKNVVIDTENQVIVERHYTNKGSVVGRYHFILGQLGWALLLLTLIVFSGQKLLGLELSWFRMAFTDPGLITAAKALGALAVSILDLHLIWALGRITFSVE